MLQMGHAEEEGPVWVAEQLSRCESLLRNAGVDIEGVTLKPEHASCPSVPPRCIIAGADIKSIRVGCITVLDTFT